MTEARTLALTPAQVASPLAGRPYDLRHAGVSLWLSAGVPAPRVAERAGHSVEVLLRIYAKCAHRHPVTQSATRPDTAQSGRPPSPAYPTSSGTQPLSVASGCMALTCNRDAEASLNC